MEVFIEGQEVVKDDIGKHVTYIPTGISDINSPSCERGIISSFTDTSIWVKFKGPNGQLCDSKNLVWG